MWTNHYDKYARHIHSSAGIAVFVSDADDAAHRVEAGRCYERFAFQATALGMGRRRPDLAVRFSRAPAIPRSLRRPVESVLV